MEIEHLRFLVLVEKLRKKGTSEMDKHECRAAAAKAAERVEKSRRELRKLVATMPMVAKAAAGKEIAAVLEAFEALADQVQILNQEIRL